MGLTLVEASKLALAAGQTLRAGVIRLFAEASPLLAAMPFESISGNSLAYNVENTLPGTAVRAVNEAYTPSTGVIEQRTEPLKIGGGDLEVDTAIAKTMPGARSVHEAQKAKSLAQQIGFMMVKGSTTTNARQFDGLQNRVPAAQIVLNKAVGGTSTSGGDPLRATHFDEAIDKCEGPTHLLMTKAMRRFLTQFLRDSPSIQTDRDEFGRQLLRYNGLPILLADEFGNTPALAFDEAATGGGTTATSIYVLRMETGYLNGIQNGVMEVRDLGEMPNKPALLTRVEWLIGMVLFQPRAIVRLRDISNAAMVA